MVSSVVTSAISSGAELIGGFAAPAIIDAFTTPWVYNRHTHAVKGIFLGSACNALPMSKAAKIGSSIYTLLRVAELPRLQYSAIKSQGYPLQMPPSEKKGFLVGIIVVILFSQSGHKNGATCKSNFTVGLLAGIITTYYLANKLHADNVDNDLDD